MHLSVRAGQYVQQLPIPADEPGIIALRIDISSPFGEVTHTGILVGFIEVRPKDDQAGSKAAFVDQTFIDIDKLWVPPSVRMGQIVDNCYIQVRIGDEFFSSNINDKKSRFVDSDTLCRYLYGNIDAIDIKREVAELKKEESAQDRVAQLEKVITDELGPNYIPPRVD
jgi:hypothetical protein